MPPSALVYSMIAKVVVGVLDASRDELFTAVHGHGLYVDGQRKR